MQRKPLAALVLALCLLGCSFQALAQEGEAVSVTVDFAQLQSLNPDCRAWLYQRESGFSRTRRDSRISRSGAAISQSADGSATRTDAQGSWDSRETMPVKPFVKIAAAKPTAAPSPGIHEQSSVTA